MENTRESFKQNFRRLFEKSGATPEDLAKVLGVSRQTVFAWVNGGAFPRADVLGDMANYFGVTLNELLTTEQSGENRLIDMFHKMNETGKALLLARAEELVLLHGEKTPDNKDVSGVI